MICPFDTPEDMLVAEVTYDDTPPSINAFGTSGNWRKVHRIKGEWAGTLGTLLLTASSIPRNLDYVEVYAVLRFNSSRRRDEDNYKMFLSKVLGDVLQRMGYIGDDTPDKYRFPELRFEKEKGPKRTTLFIAYRK